MLNIIELRLSMEDYDGASKRTEEHLWRIKEIQDRHGIVHNKIALAQIYASGNDRENNEKAMKCSREAIRLSRQYSFIPGEYIAWNIQAQIVRKMGHPDEALKCSQNALALFHQNPWGEDILVDLQFTRYQILKDLGRHQEAASSLNESFGILKKLANNIESEEFRRSFWEVPLRRRIAEAAREVGLESSQK